MRIDYAPGMVRWNLPRLLAAAVAGLVLATALAPVMAPAMAAEKKEEKKRGEVKEKDPVMVLLPGEASGARCQGEVMVNAIKRLGGLTSLKFMSTDLANATGSGINAVTSYCTEHGDECEGTANALMPKIGLVPPSCG